MRRKLLLVGVVLCAVVALAQSRGSVSEFRLPSDMNIRTAPSDYNGTLFGHTRVVEPYTLGDIINNYGLDTEIWGVDGGIGGSLEQLPSEAALRLRGDGGQFYMETHRKFRYQASRQQTILQTAMIESAQDAGEIKFGNFCWHDGLFWSWGRDGGGLAACRRTIAELGDGGIVEYCTAVDAGTSYAPQNGNIYEIRFAWLGVHEVDWYLNGRQVLSQNFDGLFPNVYMGTATLPLRAEVNGRARLKYVCSSVTSEGGVDPPTPSFSATRTATKSVSAAAGILPIIAIRPREIVTLLGGAPSAHSHIEIIPTSVSCQVSGTSENIRIYSYINPTLTGATWASSPTGTAADIDTAATAVSGGLQVCTFSAAEGTHRMDHVHFGVAQRALRVRAAGQGSDVLVVAADSVQGTHDVACSIEWWEVR